MTAEISTTVFSDASLNYKSFVIQNATEESCWPH